MSETMATRGWLIAMALYWLEAEPGTFNTKTLAWCVGTAIWNGADPTNRHLLPRCNRRSSALSWIHRHKKSIEAGLAGFISNGYVHLSEKGRRLIEAKLDQPAEVTALPRENCFACGAELAGIGRQGWMPYYACGHVTGWAGLGYVTVHSCPPTLSRGDDSRERPFTLATNLLPAKGMKVRYRLYQFHANAGADAPDLPAIGVIAGLHGACATVLPKGKPDSPNSYHPIPLNFLVEAGKADTTLLTSNQLLVLERLENGSAYVSRRKDGRGTVKAARDSRLGNITCAPGTWDALKYSGALDPYIAAAAAALPEARGRES